MRVIEAPSPCLSDGAFISLDFSHLSIYQNVGHDLGSQAKGINKSLTNFSGDFFALEDPELLAEALIGTPLDAESLCEKMKSIRSERYIVNLTSDQVVQLLLQ